MKPQIWKDSGRWWLAYMNRLNGNIIEKDFDLREQAFDKLRVIYELKLVK